MTGQPALKVWAGKGRVGKELGLHCCNVLHGVVTLGLRIPCVSLYMGLCSRRVSRKEGGKRARGGGMWAVGLYLLLE